LTQFNEISNVIKKCIKNILNVIVIFLNNGEHGDIDLSIWLQSSTNISSLWYKVKDYINKFNEQKILIW